MKKIILILSLLVIGCDNGENSIVTLQGLTMGSTYTIKYVHSKHNPADMNALHADIEEKLQTFDKEASNYREDSELSIFNNLSSKPEDNVVCSPMPYSIIELTRIGQKLNNISNRFDLTVLPLLKAWRFMHKENQMQVFRTPSTEDLEQLRKQIGMNNIEVLGGNILCRHNQAQLDYNSIGAGFILDRLKELFEARGIMSFMLEITGETYAQGTKPDGSKWRIAIEKPIENKQEIFKVIELDGYAISTSGDYRRYFEQDGIRYSHTIDINTLAPVLHSVASVTVVHKSGVMADGLSTLLMAYGDNALEFANKHDIPALIIIRDGGNNFKSQQTAKFDEFIRK